LATPGRPGPGAPQGGRQIDLVTRARDRRAPGTGRQRHRWKPQLPIVRRSAAIPTTGTLINRHLDRHLDALHGRYFQERLRMHDGADFCPRVRLKPAHVRLLARRSAKPHSPVAVDDQAKGPRQW